MCRHGAAATGRKVKSGVEANVKTTERREGARSIREYSGSKRDPLSAVAVIQAEFIKIQSPQFQLIKNRVAIYRSRNKPKKDPAKLCCRHVGYS